MSNRSALFKRVGGVKVRRSVFNLSYEKKFTVNFGYLYPVLCDECVPGDYWKIGNEIVIRFTPLIAPILHEIYATVHYFFVPYRIIWDPWEEFITRGKTGNSEIPLPRKDPALTNTAIGSLWDYFGFPTTPLISNWIGRKYINPLDFPWRAYNMIFNEYYRDEDLEPEKDLLQDGLRSRYWQKDYFTSARTAQQRGNAYAMPVTGLGNASFNGGITKVNSLPTPESGPVGFYEGLNPAFDTLYVTGQASQDMVRRWFNNNTIDFSKAGTFDVNDMRTLIQIQKWKERNMRAGVRYTEFLQSHYGTHPRDERLQRPEYIGGSKSPILISEVLQTSQTTGGVQGSPQANMAGHGITADRTYVGKYRVTEFGLVMGLLSIMPRPSYMQATNRQWLRETSYDYYSPEFAHLGEQAILEQELYTDQSVSGDGLSSSQYKKYFGFCGRYDEMRVKHNMVCGQMRDFYKHWHLSRDFGQPPFLNDTFAKLGDISRSDMARIFANLDGTVHPILVNFLNRISAVRPMPYIAEPGLMDHF